MISGKLGIPLITDNMIENRFDEDHTLNTVSSVDANNPMNSKALICFCPKVVSFPDTLSEETKSVNKKSKK